MRMQVVIIGEYNLEESLSERLNNYGTTDPDECAAIDMENDPAEFLELAELKVTTFHIEPMDDGVGG